MKRIICDKCGAKFSELNIKVKSVIVDKDKDVRKQYFKCPKCKEKYTVLITDPVIRKLISEGKKYEAKARELMLRAFYEEK